MPLYLASTSPARLTLLRSAGVEPVVIPSDVDEEAMTTRTQRELGRALTAAETVQLLARAKAEAVSNARPELDGFLLGCDSVFVVGDTVYGKPYRPEIARERWQLQRGASGVLHTGHWLIDRRTASTTTPGSATSPTLTFSTATEPGAPTPPIAAATTPPARGAVATATVTFAADMTDSEIDAYIASGEPLKVAGAFTIDSLGAPFIDRIEGDPSTVVGLSLPTLRRLVRGLGGEWPQLWNCLAN